MSDDLRDKLLQSPEVQDAISKAGANAMQDPAVKAAMQEQLNKQMANLQGQAPELAKEAMDKAMNMANDPAVQAKAKEYASKGMAMAGVAAGQAGAHFMEKIEQGPGGVRFLAFVGACVSSTLAVMTIINPLNALAVTDYILSGYLLVFAVSTALFEMPPEYVEKVPKVSEYQDLLREKCNFLSDVGGRGLFYCFQGTLWLALSGITEVTDMACGAYLTFIGALHVAMHFGIMPKEAIAKLKQGYTQVSARGQP